jgi:hypothetical protein
VNRRKGEKVKGNYIKAQAIEIGRLGKKENPTKPTQPRPKSSPKPSHGPPRALRDFGAVEGVRDREDNIHFLLLEPL